MTLGRRALSLLVRFDEADRVAIAPDLYLVTRVSCVGLRPAPNTVLGETLLAGGTLPAVRAPGRDAIGEMAGMPHMIERELFDGLIADAQFVEFEGEVPLATTA